MKKKSAFTNMAGAVALGIAIGGLAWSLTVMGQAQQPVLVADPGGSPDDIQLGVAKHGLLTFRNGNTVRIDGAIYTLDYNMMIQQPDGSPVLYQDLVGDNLDLPVHFWLGQGQYNNAKIVKMIVYFPR